MGEEEPFDQQKGLVAIYNGMSFLKQNRFLKRVSSQKFQNSAVADPPLKP